MEVFQHSLFLFALIIIIRCLTGKNQEQESGTKLRKILNVQNAAMYLVFLASQIEGCIRL